MKSGGEKITNLVLKRTLVAGGDATKDSPAVLSCGGIYIPHRNDARGIPYHLISTPHREEAVKVVAAAPQRNMLFEILHKESMN